MSLLSGSTFSWIVLPFICVLGLCLGSFATALIYRIPLGVSWIRREQGKDMARSACPSCGTRLKAYDLFPLISWLSTQGRCRYCHVEIPAWYPLTEGASLILCVLLYASWGLSPAALPLYALVPFLIAAIVIDWRYMILPDSLNGIIFSGALLHFFILWHSQPAQTLLIDRIAGAVLLPFLFYFASKILSLAKKRPALGGGDIKFLPSAGLIIGLHALPAYCILAGCLGIVSFFF